MIVAPNHYLNQVVEILVRTLRTYFGEIWIKVQQVSVMQEMSLKMSSTKWRLFCLGQCINYFHKCTILKSSVNNSLFQQMNMEMSSATTDHILLCPTVLIGLKLQARLDTTARTLSSLNSHPIVPTWHIFALLALCVRKPTATRDFAAEWSCCAELYWLDCSEKQLNEW